MNGSYDERDGSGTPYTATTDFGRSDDQSYREPAIMSLFSYRRRALPLRRALRE
jgi:hypothetical protein